MVEDKLLIWRLKTGRLDGLRQIYEKYRSDMLKLAVFLTNDVDTAEDVVQDVFVKFAQSAGRLGPRRSLKKYLVACVANRIRNLGRDQQRHQVRNTDQGDCIACDLKSPQEWAVLSEELRRLSSAMAKIPPEQREAVALYMQSDMTFRQIAKVQGATVSTVRGRYRYGLKKLRSLLDSEVT
jgi:RNA polymerase sigma-70 factor (ECF subfamily)